MTNTHISTHTNTPKANNAGLKGKVHVSLVSPGLINTEFGMNVVRKSCSSCFRLEADIYLTDSIRQC